MKTAIIERLREEIKNAFEDLENKDLDALYGTLLEISENIINVQSAVHIILRKKFFTVTSRKCS